ncbi:MAG: hypothetical protein ACJ8CN_16200, partial [Gemmatimonadales bacterium]
MVSTDRVGTESLAGAVVSALAARLVSGLLVLVDSAFVSSALATVSGVEELPLSDRCGAGAAVATVAESRFAELSAAIGASRTPPGAYARTVVSSASGLGVATAGWLRCPTVL